MFGLKKRLDVKIKGPLISALDEWLGIYKGYMFGIFWHFLAIKIDVYEPFCRLIPITDPWDDCI